jgi:hypothetical protein
VSVAVQVPKPREGGPEAGAGGGAVEGGDERAGGAHDPHVPRVDARHGIGERGADGEVVAEVEIEVADGREHAAEPVEWRGALEHRDGGKLAAREEVDAPALGAAHSGEQGRPDRQLGELVAAPVADDGEGAAEAGARRRSVQGARDADGEERDDGDPARSHAGDAVRVERGAHDELRRPVAVQVAQGEGAAEPLTQGGALDDLQDRTVRAREELHPSATEAGRPGIKRRAARDVGGAVARDVGQREQDPAALILGRQPLEVEPHALTHPVTREEDEDAEPPRDREAGGADRGRTGAPRGAPAVRSTFFCLSHGDANENGEPHWAK